PRTTSSNSRWRAIPAVTRTYGCRSAARGAARATLTEPAAGPKPRVPFIARPMACIEQTAFGGKYNVNVNFDASPNTLIVTTRFPMFDGSRGAGPTGGCQRGTPVGAEGPEAQGAVQRRHHPDRDAPLWTCRAPAKQHVEVPITGSRGKAVLYRALNPATGAQALDGADRWDQHTFQGWRRG